ncbi:MAG: penicillin-binding protein 2 [Patescibacteria group bacterium]|nr:penicillin-binding protein 2 [Patescibacteria group bacterium]
MLQIVNHESLVAKAQKQHQFFEKLKPNRGQIYLKDGETNIIPIATNEDQDMVVIVPKYITDTEGTIQTLATILNMDTEEVRRKVMKRDDLYEIIKRKLTKEESTMIAEKQMVGVELIPEGWRNYPEGELASQVLGFVGHSNDKRVGQYGIEGSFNDILEGEVGFLKAEKDTAGRWISISKRILEKPKQGTDIVLTLDQTVQYFVEKLLKESITKYGASKGSVIVMEPDTGKVVAMANFPTYSNGEFNKVEDSALFKNDCVQSQYEPGSVFKPITASAAVDLGKLTPDSTYIDKGSYSVAGFTIHNSDGKAYGQTTLTRFLELSLNTGAIWVMQSTGKENFLKYVKNYGLDRSTGIELLGEAEGDVSNLEHLRDINFVTASFGQGVSITPIQLVTAFSAIINGGHLMEPRIVDRFIYDSEKKSEEKVAPKKVRQVISPKTSATMRAMLISVVKNGWGKKAGVPGYLIGGKTGTAQIPNEDRGGYSDEVVHSFVGFGPADNPKFITLVKLDKVSAVNFSSDSATLVAGRLHKFLLDYYHIFPTEKIKEDELKYFNRLMEIKEEDIKKAGEESLEGAEGLSPLEKDESKKDKKDKKKKR